MSMRELVRSSIPRRFHDLARGAVFTAISPFFVGSQVECPVCAKTSRSWISLGFPNLVCPHCSAFDRQRLLILYLRNELGISDKPVIMLHFAPESCLMRHFRNTLNLTYIAADLDPPRGAVRMDITDIALEADSVDLVICSHVLEHVPDDAKALRELRRVLRPAGRALIMGPVDHDRPTTYEDPSIVSPKARLAAFNQSDHVRIYGADFDERLRAAGFQVDANHYALSLGERAITRYGLRREDIIYVCTHRSAGSPSDCRLDIRLAKPVRGRGH